MSLDSETTYPYFHLITDCISNAIDVHYIRGRNLHTTFADSLLSAIYDAFDEDDSVETHKHSDNIKGVVYGLVCHDSDSKQCNRRLNISCIVRCILGNLNPDFPLDIRDLLSGCLSLASELDIEDENLARRFGTALAGMLAFALQIKDQNVLHSLLKLLHAIVLGSFGDNGLQQAPFVDFYLRHSAPRRRVVCAPRSRRRVVYDRHGEVTP